MDRQGARGRGAGGQGLSAAGQERPEAERLRDLGLADLGVRRGARDRGRPRGAGADLLLLRLGGGPGRERHHGALSRAGARAARRRPGVPLPAPAALPSRSGAPLPLRSDLDGDRIRISGLGATALGGAFAVALAAHGLLFGLGASGEGRGPRPAPLPAAAFARPSPSWIAPAEDGLTKEAAATLIEKALLEAFGPLDGKDSEMSEGDGGRALPARGGPLRPLRAAARGLLGEAARAGGAGRGDGEAMGVRAAERDPASRTALAAVRAGGLLATAPWPRSARPTRRSRFRQGNELARAGDYPKALAAYRELAAAGAEGPRSTGTGRRPPRREASQGEALWALLRARELDPGRPRRGARDRARARGGQPRPGRDRPRAPGRRRSLRPPLPARPRRGRPARPLRAPAPRRARPRPARWGSVSAGVAFALGLLAAGAPVAGSFARPTAVVVRRGAPLLDQASPTAEAVGSLREGEVVPVLDASGDYLRIEDSSGARGWAVGSDVRRLDRPRRAEAAPDPGLQSRGLIAP